ncbi:MAG: hypothetical protein EHM93_10850 [Bacteroidales bacterium]|nr:MAG: hypothetical protein EHM93_10850 [Bacteroidales bacterium]
MKNDIFKAEKVSRTETFVVSGKIEIVFPLFGAFEERKWEPTWNPILIYPSEEVIEEGTTFKTDGRDDETEFLWRVSKYEKDLHLIQYLVSTENRYWTITVKCSKYNNEDKTNVTVTYTFIGLNIKGNELNKVHIQSMYEYNLKDWADAINKYLKTK